jgi:hypothetical protein
MIWSLGWWWTSEFLKGKPIRGKSYWIWGGTISVLFVGVPLIFGYWLFQSREARIAAERQPAPNTKGFMQFDRVWIHNKQFVANERLKLDLYSSNKGSQPIDNVIAFWETGDSWQRPYRR